MQISELLQFEQMPAAAAPKDVCYQDVPRVWEQANKGTKPCTGLVLYHFYAAPEEVTRFGIHMERTLEKQ
jgi:sensor domain CHASE-containing protein